MKNKKQIILGVGCEATEENLYYWYHYDNRGNENQNYDDDPEHFENWKKENIESKEVA
tara:strand:- start:4406 stop:4579 length:174 start_codon:yes stop_codon:yes gene_type:complete